MIRVRDLETFCKNHSNSCHEDDQVSDAHPKLQAHGQETQEAWSDEVDEWYDEEKYKGI